MDLYFICAFQLDTMQLLFYFRYFNSVNPALAGSLTGLQDYAAVLQGWSVYIYNAVF